MSSLIKLGTVLLVELNGIFCTKLCVPVHLHMGLVKSITNYRLYKLYYSSFCSVPTVTSRWHCQRRRPSSTRVWWSGDLRPSIIRPARWTSSTSPSTSRPASWSSAAGPMMDFRYETVIWHLWTYSAVYVRIRTSLTWLWWFGFSHQPIFATVPAAPKYIPRFKSGHKWHENNYFDSFSLSPWDTPYFRCETYFNSSPACFRHAVTLF